MTEAQKLAPSVSKLIDGGKSLLVLRFTHSLQLSLKSFQVHQLNLVKIRILKPALLTWQCRVYFLC